MDASVITGTLCAYLTVLLSKTGTLELVREGGGFELRNAAGQEVTVLGEVVQMKKHEHLKVSLVVKGDEEYYLHLVHELTQKRDRVLAEIVELDQPVEVVVVPIVAREPQYSLGRCIVSWAQALRAIREAAEGSRHA
jgi:hypothetical protein